MNCSWNLCEFINVAIGGILTGVVASVIFSLLYQKFAICRFKKTYKYLASTPRGDYDWIAYSMCEDSQSKRQKEPNGSKVNIQIGTNLLKLKLHQMDNETWSGEIVFHGYKMGVLTYKYDSKYEFGKKECSIGTYSVNNEIFDYILLTPVDSKILSLDNNNDQKQRVIYIYGNELFLRKRENDGFLKKVYKER